MIVVRSIHSKIIMHIYNCTIVKHFKDGVRLTLFLFQRSKTVKGKSSCLITIACVHQMSRKLSIEDFVLLNIILGIVAS
jgi:hypothetical protein